MRTEDETTGRPAAPPQFCATSDERDEVCDPRDWPALGRGDLGGKPEVSKPSGCAETRDSHVSGSMEVGTNARDLDKQEAS